jgi:hypothetical protein
VWFASLKRVVPFARVRWQESREARASSVFIEDIPASQFYVKETYFHAL